MPSIAHFRDHDLRRYLIALLATAAAVAVMRLIQPFVAPSVTPPFILAVAVAALYGGRGPGGLAAVLSVAALSLWFFPSLHTDTLADLARQLMFALVATVIALIAGSAHDQRRRALRQAIENDRLRHGAEQAEAAVRRSEAGLADFFETASIGLRWVAADGTILRANQAELDMLGYTREEYLGLPVAGLHTDPPAIEDLLRRLAAGETIRRHPARLRRKDGQVKEVEIDASPYVHDGRLAHTRWFTRDLTLERQAQEAQARLAAIVTSSSDAIAGKTLDGVITSWNAAAERIFGYPAAEMIGDTVFKLIPPEYHAEERDVLARVRRGEQVEFSHAERIRKDGRRIWISLSVSPVRDGHGTITGAASIKRDITEQKLLEDRVRDTQRLQAVGQLAGGIAHEANNQMSVVLGGAHFLLRRSDLSEGARSDVEQIRLAAERTAAITRQLLAFSRRQMLELREVDLNEVVQSIGPVLQRSLTENQGLVIRPALQGGTVRADPRQLEQVLLNLALNARDAMPDGGTLTIETGELSLTGAIAEHEGLAPGRYQTLIVTDTGKGMDQATRDRAFEPFFTTKEVGQGTGLGLSVVHGIVNQTGGHIRVESAVGKGTSFKVYFPLAVADAAPGTAVPSPPPPGPDPGAVALVVEDDLQVRGMAVRALADAGYRTLEAADGQAAMEMVRRHDGRLDLVLTDVGMPGMSGYELARRLRQQRPALPVLFMTGYGDRDQRERGSGGVAGVVIQKPFAPDELVRVAQGVVSGAAPVSPGTE